MSYLTQRRKRWVIVTCILLAPIGGLGLDVYSPALPFITQVFGTSAALVKLTMTFYLLGYGVSQAVFGTLSDSLGRRSLMLIGMLLYLFASVLVSFAKSIDQLLVFRVLQGLTAAAGTSIAKAILADICSPEELRRANGWVISAWMLGPVLGPVIGGYLQHYIDWRADFYFLCVYGAISLGLVFFIIPETIKEKVPLSFGLISHNLAVMCSHVRFLFLIAMMGLGYSFLVMFNVVGPFYIQVVLGLSVIAFGHYAMTVGLFNFVGTLVNRFVMSFCPDNWLIGFGVVVILVSVVVMLIFSLFIHHHLLLIILPVAVMVFGVGFIFTNSMTKALQLFPKTSGSASALLGSFVMLFSGVTGSAASFFRAHTLFPLAVCYVIMAVLLGLSYCFVLLREKA